MNEELNDDELKPCPFCGCPDIEEHIHDVGNLISCTECGGSMWRGVTLMAEFDQALFLSRAAWNTRNEADSITTNG